MQDLRTDDPTGNSHDNLAHPADCRLALPHVVLATPADVYRERPQLLALARRLAINPHDADDLVQDTMVRALPALGKVATGGHLRAWLLTILRRVHIDRMRRAARTPEAVSLDNVTDDVLAADAAAPHAAHAMDDGEDAHRRDLEAALRCVPEAFRQVLVRHELEGQSYREIADALELPLSTVGTRLNRGRLKLRDVLAVQRRARAARVARADQ